MAGLKGSKIVYQGTFVMHFNSNVGFDNSVVLLILICKHECREIVGFFSGKWPPLYHGKILNQPAAAPRQLVNKSFGHGEFCGRPLVDMLERTTAHQLSEITQNFMYYQ